MYNVFLSYLRDDKTQALKLAKELKSNGAAVWVDVTDLTIGASWREEIAQAIRQAEFFLACFSSTYEERPNNGMLDELNYVISLRKSGGKHPEILPIKLNECDIPDLQIDSNRNLNELHWYLLDDQNWNEGVRQLLEITLRMAKERARASLKKEAEDLVVKNSRLVRAREELRSHDRRAMRHQRAERRRAYSRRHSTSLRSLKLPSVWPAQNVAKRETEYKQARAEYDEHQAKFLRRFDEDYHPLGELFDKMHEAEERIHQEFEEERRDEDESIKATERDVIHFLIFIAMVAVVGALFLFWIRSC